MKKLTLLLPLIPGILTTYAATLNNSSPIERMDNNLRNYYALHGVEGYDNDDGVGEFRKFCKDNGYGPEEIKEDLFGDDFEGGLDGVLYGYPNNSELVDYFKDKKFPINENNGKTAELQIFGFLQNAYLNPNGVIIRRSEALNKENVQTLEGLKILYMFLETRDSNVLVHPSRVLELLTHVPEKVLLIKEGKKIFDRLEALCKDSIKRAVLMEDDINNG